MTQMHRSQVVADLAIVGAGSAAFSAAIRASGLGAKVVLIEQGVIGGTCGNVGCVPSKALIVAAETRHRAMTQPFPGISTQAGPVVMDALVAGKRALVDDLRTAKYEDLARAYGFTILNGQARFVAGGALVVSGAPEREVVATNMVIATGATPKIPPIPGLDTVEYLTSATAMDLAAVPERLLVLGGGAIGLEYAQLFAHLGAAVTLIEVRDRIVATEEPEISTALVQVLADQGVEVVTAATIGKVSRFQGSIRVEIKEATMARHFEGDALLVATGREPNTAGLGLTHVGVEVGSDGEVVVDEFLQTSNQRIYAAGDVTGAPQFVYVAGLHGSIVADNALTGVKRRVDYRTLPRVTFTTPSIASVGLTQERATAAGYRCESRTLDLAVVPRAIVNRDEDGIIKIVADGDTGRVLGIHLLADGASEVILAGVYALEANFSVDQLATVWAPYLTMSEALRLGGMSFTQDIDSLSCCASS